MKLHVNKEHLKANISSIVVASCVTAVVGGSYISFFNDNYTDEQKQYYYNELNDLRYFLEDSLNITNNLNNMNIVKINSNNDNKWVNECNNIKRLEIIIRNEDISKLNNLNNLSNLKEVCIKSTRDNDDIIFNEENFSFLKDCKELYSITFDNIQVEPKFLEQFKALESIFFEKESFFNCNLDFTKFPNLSWVKFGDLKTYDLAMFLNHKSIKYFEYKNIHVDSNIDSNLKNNLIKIDEEFEFINRRLWRINKNSSDVEKLNCIIKYLIMNFDYSDNFLKMSEVEQLKYKKEILYKDGYLYGGLYNNGDVICGNYAAMFQALANRFGLESYFITSNDHAWNLVNIDDNYYYTDVTWLDDESAVSLYYFLSNTLNKLNSEEKVTFEWYLKDPNIYYDDSHVANYSPYKIDIYLEEKNESDFTKWKYSVQLFNGDKIIIPYISLTYLLITIWSSIIYDIKKNNIKDDSIKKI